MMDGLKEQLAFVNGVLTEEDHFRHAISLINFDMETICPREGMSEEGELLSFLDSKAFALRRDPAFVEAAEALYEGRDELEERIGQAIIAQQDKLDLEEEGLYDMPEVYADDPGLIAQKEQYDELNDLVITLKFGSKTVPINIQTISGWLKSSKKGKNRASATLLLTGACSVVDLKLVSISCAVAGKVNNPMAKAITNILKVVFIFKVGGFYGFCNSVNFNGFRCVDEGVLM